MNYFELFDLPISFKIDKNKLQQRFYALSKKYHPDFFSLSNDEEKAGALEQSSYLNIAYKTLNNEDAIIPYVLKLKNIYKEDEKYTLEPAFLMDMMELNEGLMEANAEQIKNYELRIMNFKNELYELVKKIVEDYKEGVTTEKELLQVKDYYYKKKYMDRILEGIKG